MSPSYFLPIANHLWQSTLFAGLAGLVILALRKNRARVRHWVWLAASCKFLIPLSILTALGAHISWRQAPVTPPGPSIVMDEVSQPFSDLAVPAPLSPPVPPAQGPFLAALLIVWIGGFAGIGCSWWIRWRRILATVRAGAPVPIAAPIQARSSPTLLEPGVFGILRPVLLLPQGIFVRLTPAQLQAVIAHELCHIRYRDNLTAGIHMFVETVFWFHPLVWWIGKRMVEERERACDEEVLQLGNEPQVYAEGVLNICKLYVESPLTCVSGVTGSSLKPRIQAILANRPADRISFAKRALLAGLGAAAVLLPIGIGMVKAPLAQAQTAALATAPQFEVASVKACKDDGRSGSPAPSPGRLDTSCMTVMGLIQIAYERFAGGRFHPLDFRDFPPIEGGPKWVDSDRFEISAKADGRFSQAMLNGPMLQALLEDRFKLKLHRESRVVPVYDLTIAKGGPKLQPLKEGSCTILDLEHPAPPPPPGEKPAVACGTISGRRKGPQQMMDVHGMSLDEFSKFGMGLFGRPVINRTGIAGKFDWHLEFAPSNAGDDLAGPSIFTAIQEQLGLKLVPAKGPTDFLVIDQLQRPSEN
jgi:uncharacterized protein (TIGR03435 family)